MQFITGYLKSIAVFTLSVIVYFFSEKSEFLDELLPEQGKPLAIFTVVCVVLLFEYITLTQKDAQIRFVELKNAIERGRLIQDVNRLYDTVMNDDEEYITNEYTIKEIADLTDLREELQVNSYTQGKLNNLNDKIKRT